MICGTWDVGRGTWDVGRGTWDVGRGTWDVGRGTWDGMSPVRCPKSSVMGRVRGNRVFSKKKESKGGAR